MYSAFRQFCERVLRIPPEPEPPPGDETKTQIFRAAPNYYKYLLVLWVLTHAYLVLVPVVVLVVLLGIVLRSKADAGFWILILVFLALIVFHLVLAVFSLAIVRLNYEKRWYVVTNRSLRVREGVFVVREATITFANIQNISISQGPLQRLLGIADLRVDTAGGGGAGNTHQGKFPSRNLHVAWFRGVNNAKEIRELMQQRLRHLKDAGLGDHEDLVMHAPVEIPSGFLAALREVRAEAAALRQVVGQGR